jgi:hypothetical protein
VDFREIGLSMGLEVTGRGLRFEASFIVRCSELGDVASHLAIPASDRGNTGLLPGQAMRCVW